VTYLDATPPSEVEKKKRPQAGVGKLKHAPPMQASDLPLVAQAVPPANYIVSHLLRERFSDTLANF
jgi:hypothetical protein